MAYFLCMLTLGPALAAPPRPKGQQAQDEMDRHYQAAVGFYEAGEYERSIQEFKAAFAIRQFPRFLYNIGQAYRKMGYARLALRYFQQYRSMEVNPPPREKAAVDRAVQEVEAMLQAADQVGRARGEHLVVLLERHLEGALSKEERSLLDLGVADALRGVGMQAVSGANLEAVLEGEPELRGCRGDDCQDRIGRLLSAQTVLTQRWKVERIAGSAGDGDPGRGAEPKRKFTFGVTLFNVVVGAIGASEQAACSACTMDEAARVLGELLKKVVQQEAARPRGTIEVIATPSADVLVDGRKLGVTPYSREAYVGKHEVAIMRLGYRSHHDTLTVEPGGKHAVAATLKVGYSEDSVTPEELRQRRNRLIFRVVGGMVGVGMGVSMVVVGAGALSVNGLSGLDAMGRERFDTIYNTLAPGTALTVVGSAVVVGAVLAILPWEQFARRRAKVTMSATAGPSQYGIALSGAF